MEEEDEQHHEHEHEHECDHPGCSNTTTDDTPYCIGGCDGVFCADHQTPGEVMCHTCIGRAQR